MALTISLSFLVVYPKDVKSLWVSPLACAFAIWAWAQAPSGRFPQFGDYPVSDVLKGKPAPPKLLRPRDRRFRTTIRQGAAKGPNFAGHYTVTEWGCGSSCVSIAVVDAQTGEVYFGPFNILGYGRLLKYADVPVDNDEPLSYKLKSRLFIVRGCPEDKHRASYFYEWNGSQFKLIRKLAAVPIQP